MGKLNEDAALAKLHGAAGPTGTAVISSAATTNPTSVKGAAGRILGLSLTNVSGAAKFLKLYDKATAPTVGTDLPLLTIPIPAAGNVQLSAFAAQGLQFNLGIAYAITGLITDADATAVAARDVNGAISYI